MSKQAAADLKAARALIADPKNWTEKTGARDDEGRPVSPLSSRATCFCALGAINRATYNDRDREHAVEEFLYAYLEAAYPTGGAFIIHVNDGLGHTAVLDMFDKAVALAEASS